MSSLFPQVCLYRGYAVCKLKAFICSCFQLFFSVFCRHKASKVKMAAKEAVEKELSWSDKELVALRQAVPKVCENPEVGKNVGRRAVCIKLFTLCFDVKVEARSFVRSRAAFLSVCKTENVGVVVICSDSSGSNSISVLKSELVLNCRGALRVHVGGASVDEHRKIGLAAIEESF